MVVPVQSRKCQSYIGVRGYSDIGVPSLVWLSWYSPGNVRVTPAFGDTLTQGVPRVSSCVRFSRYSPGNVRVTPAFGDTLTQGVPRVSSCVRLSWYSPKNVRVTPAFGNTLTQGYLAVCGYPGTVQGMSELHQRSGIL